MYLTPEQLLSTHRANVETMFGLTTKTFEGVEKLFALNLQAAKTTLAEMSDTTVAMLAVKDVQELLALQAGLVQPAAEKAANYGRTVYDIVSGTGSEVGKVAEAQLADAQRRVLTLVDTAVKNAPAGTENAAALVKSAVAATNNAYESMTKAAKQAAEVAGANFQAVSNTVANGAVQAAQATPKPAANRQAA